MADTIVVGTLSTRGWARTPEEKIREVMNNYTEAGYSQSVIYRDNIRSYSYARQMCTQQDPDTLREYVENDLIILYGNVFPEKVSVTAEVVYDETETEKWKLKIAIEIYDNGIPYSAEKYVNVEDKNDE